MIIWISEYVSVAVETEAPAAIRDYRTSLDKPAQRHIHPTGVVEHESERILSLASILNGCRGITRIRCSPAFAPGFIPQLGKVAAGDIIHRQTGASQVIAQQIVQRAATPQHHSLCASVLVLGLCVRRAIPLKIFANICSRGLSPNLDLHPVVVSANCRSVDVIPNVAHILGREGGGFSCKGLGIFSRYCTIENGGPGSAIRSNLRFGVVVGASVADVVMPDRDFVDAVYSSRTFVFMLNQPFG